MHDDPTAIPAATIADFDLSGAPPEAAAEIRRLGELMENGDETPEQFARLVQLLYELGVVEKSEYLLRRNVPVVRDGAALYRALFGTEKPDRFAAAIETFGRQFAVALHLIEETDFLERHYRSVPSGDLHDRPRALSGQCDVRFDYSDEITIGANASSGTTDEYAFFQWDGASWLSDDRE